MEHYTYYSVVPKHMDERYSYLSDRDIPVGSCVEIPFGVSNRVRQGRVVSKRIYTAENAPWPVERMKKILRVITESEYTAGTEAQQTRAVRRLEKCMEEENIKAVYAWAVKREECGGAPEIMRNVVRAYRFCIQRGCTYAAVRLGNLYYNGRFLKRDYRQAAELYQIAADAGDVEAVCNLGYCYYYGRHQDPDYAEAYRYFSLGAAMNDDPNCLYKLGDLYWNGLYVKQDKRIAEQLYFRARDEVPVHCDDEKPEEYYCYPDILLRLGMVCLEGGQRWRSAKNALEYLKLALTGFYDRRNSDTFVADPIARTKKLIEKAEQRLEREMLSELVGGETVLRRLLRANARKQKKSRRKGKPMRFRLRKPKKD